MDERIGVILDDFQPLHFRQIKLIEQAYSECDKIIILVEDANLPLSINHPYKYPSIFESLITFILDQKYDINKFKIHTLISMPNTAFYVHYIDWVLKTNYTHFYFSTDEDEEKVDLFRKENKEIVFVDNNVITNKQMREKIACRWLGEDWSLHIPCSIKKILDKNFMGEIYCD